MKCLPLCTAKAVLLVTVLTIPFTLKAEMRTGRVLVEALSGNVTVTTPSGLNQRAHSRTHLDVGTILKTGADSTIDLILGYNGTVLRLTPNSVLRIAQLDQDIAGENVITETKLELVSGALAGTQRKLASPSYLEIKTPAAVARIKGTEYYVRADGAVSVISGEVSINYNMPGGGGTVKVTIPAGFSFDPATGTVVPTNASYLQNIIAHVVATRNNAETFKINGATLVVKVDKDDISPSKPKGNNGVGNGQDPQPPGNPPINDGPGTGPGNPGNKGH
jgi:hypothetical protein